MTIQILAFAQARDIFGFSERTVECDPADTPRTLLPRFQTSGDLTFIRIALDQEYRDWDTAIGTAKELALIPPRFRRLKMETKIDFTYSVIETPALILPSREIGASIEFQGIVRELENGSALKGASV